MNPFAIEVNLDELDDRRTFTEAFSRTGLNRRQFSIMTGIDRTLLAHYLDGRRKVPRRCALAALAVAVLSGVPVVRRIPQSQHTLAALANHKRKRT